MRVLWNNHRDLRHPSSGGAERTIQSVGSRLVAAGHEVHVLTSQWRGAAPFVVVDGVRIHRFPGNVGPHLAAPVLARALAPDVVVDDLAHVVPWFTPQFGGRRGVAFFRHLHRRTLPGQAPFGVRSMLAGVESLYPLVYRTWQFAVESSSSRSDLETLGVPADRITVLPPGVDLVRFAPSERSARPSFVFFAGIRRYKRPDHAIRAFALLRGRGIDASLTVVGDGPTLAELRPLAGRLGVATDVEFVGRVDESNVPARISRAWVNVNCSVSEGWGYTILEAAACGVPTAGYAVPGVREAVGSGAAGSLAPDGDIPALSATMERLVETNDDLRGRCRTYAEGLPWTECARRWEALLESVALLAG
jgi:glycosyltransferase involved in cell wall biosynthesis